MNNNSTKKSYLIKFKSTIKKIWAHFQEWRKWVEFKIRFWYHEKNVDVENEEKKYNKYGIRVSHTHEV